MFIDNLIVFFFPSSPVVLYYLSFFDCPRVLGFTMDRITMNATMTPADQRATSRLHLVSLPVEIIGLIVQYILDNAAGMGSEQEAIALASTSRTMYEASIEVIWSHVIGKSSVYLLHWAAEHGRLDTMEQAMAYGADPNKPLTSAFDFYQDDTIKYHRRPECSSALPAPDEIEAYAMEKAKLIRKKGWSDSQWYRADTLEAIDRVQFSELIDWYCGEPVLRLGGGDALVAGAEEENTKVLLLRAFLYWTTPLHIAVREGHKEIVGYLLRNGADPDVTAYGTCKCHQKSWDYGRPTNVNAFSPLHQATCNSCADKEMECALVQAGTSYFELPTSMLSTGSLVQPIFTPTRNLLHEALASFEDICGVQQLLDSGFKRRLGERDEHDRLAVDVAIKSNMDSEIVKALLSKDMLAGTTLVRVPELLGRDERCSVLVWAILSGEWRFAMKLLGKGEDDQSDAQPLKTDTTVVATISRITALHAVCMGPQEGVKATFDRRSREVVFQRLLEINATQVNARSVTNRTPLTEAMACVAELCCDSGGSLKTTEARSMLALVECGASPFEGIETDKCPLEVFLEVLSRPSNRHICDDEEDAAAVLEILAAIDFDRYRSEPLQAQQYDRVFQILTTNDLSQMDIARRLLAGVRTGPESEDDSN